MPIRPKRNKLNLKQRIKNYIRKSTLLTRDNIEKTLIGVLLLLICAHYKSTCYLESMDDVINSNSGYNEGIPIERETSIESEPTANWKRSLLLFTGLCVGGAILIWYSKELFVNLVDILLSVLDITESFEKPVAKVPVIFLEDMSTIPKIVPYNLYYFIGVFIILLFISISFIIKQKIKSIKKLQDKKPINDDK